MTTTKRTYLKDEVRRDQILTAAIDMALSTGYNSLTRDGIAKQAGVASGQVNHKFNTMTQLRRNVMRAAVSRELLPIIASGLAMGDVHAQKAPQWLQEKAVLSTIKK